MFFLSEFIYTQQKKRVDIHAQCAQIKIIAYFSKEVPNEQNKLRTYMEEVQSQNRKHIPFFSPPIRMKLKNVCVLLIL